jgi:hypothetical protein
MMRVNQWQLSCLIVLMLAFGTETHGVALAQDVTALNRALDARWQTQNVPAVEGQIAFTHAGKLEFGVLFGYQPNDDYANVFPFTFDVMYHMDEFWRVGLRGFILMAHTDTKLKRFLEDHQPTLDASLLYEGQLGDILAVASYQPAYGKWTAGTSGLGAFDWGLMAGLGAVIVDAPNKEKMKREKKAHFEGLLGLQAHVFFTTWVALSLEASIRLYQGTDRFMAPCFLGLGISFYAPVAQPREDN